MLPDFVDKLEQSEIAHKWKTTSIFATMDDSPTTMDSKTGYKPTCTEAYIAQQYN